MKSLRALCLLATLAAACTAEDLDDFLDPDGGAGGPGPGGTGGSGGTPTPACNALPLDGAAVTQVMHGGTLIFYGGTPANGTYRLVKAESTTRPSSSAERRTIGIAGNVLEFAGQSSDGTVSRWSATFTTSNIDLTLTRTCGGTGTVQTYKYTAMGTTLVLQSGAVVYTYAR